MAIFANKKDRRRHHQAAAEASKETVHIEIPDRHANAHDGVLTKANIPAAAAGAEGVANDTTGGATPDVPSDRAPDGREVAAADSQAETAAAGGTANVVASTAAGNSDGPASDVPGAAVTAAEGAAAAPEIEPVDIEPEVIEAPAEPTPAFGIADAIRLMRSLPADPNIDLVVRVVRVTLGAVNVSVDDILRDAEKKELKVRESITALENEVTALEMTLHEKRAAIAAHQADLRETATVRERLHLADKYTPHPPPVPPDAVRVPPRPREWDRFDADHPFKTKDS